jgi:quinol monooxygenase YgiN
MKAIKKRKLLGITLVVLFWAMAQNTRAQEKKQMVRIAKIKVNPTHLDAYNKALKEQMNAAIQLEPGVLTYYAVSDKNAPTTITILEIYADTIAYQSHIETVHFKKYKTTVNDMVTSLELVDVNLIAAAVKGNK